MKNFFYKTNDILLAILILAIAIGVIAWRMNVIMDYPNTIGEDSQPVAEETVNDDDSDEATSSDTASEEVTTDDSANGTLWQDGKLTKSVSVKVAGGSAVGAVDCLIDAGLFKSYSQFESFCKKAGTKAENIKAGSFKFNKGMTKTKIAKMVTQ